MLSGLPRSNLPVLLLGSLDSIRSMTRFQKLAFLSDREIFKDAKYADWKPHYYGPFSDDLERDVEHYVGAGLVKSELVDHPASHEPVSLHSLTPAGISEFESNFKANEYEIGEMQRRLYKYQFHDTNAELLYYVYKHHEEYTKKSLIRKQYA